MVNTFLEFHQFFLCFAEVPLDCYLSQLHSQLTSCLDSKPVRINVNEGNGKRLLIETCTVAILILHYRVHLLRHAYKKTNNVIDLFSLYVLFPISDHVMLLEGIVSFKMSSYGRANVHITNEKKQGKFL